VALLAAGSVASLAANVAVVDRLNQVLKVPGAAGSFALDNHGRLVNFTVPVYVDSRGRRAPFTPPSRRNLACALRR
jgi:hypothetical protein